MRPDAPVAIGDEQFLAKLSGNTAEIPEGLEQVSITSDAEGNIIGDTRHIDPNLLAQLQTPEARKQIAEMHEAWKNNGGKLPQRAQKEPKREPRYLNEGTQRFVTTKRPKGMTRAEAKAFRAAIRHERHKLRKAALKMQRSLHHGN